jgi:peptidoglycan/LPS O-acetylase OafA/YrhL
MKSRNYLLDLLRVYLALCVVNEHITVLYNMDESLFLFLPSNIAVYVFFIMSGYFNYFSIVKYKIKEFYFNRFKRIYPQYLAVVCLSLILFIKYLQINELFDYIFFNSVMLNFLKPSFTNFNILSQGTVFNGSLWSIKYEVFYFVIAPLIYHLTHKSVLKKILINISPFVLYYLFQDTVFFYFCFFTIGNLIAKKEYVFIFILSFLSIFLLPLSFIYSVILFGIFLILSMKYNVKLKTPDISYELYLVHFPIIQFVRLYFREFNLLAFIVLIIFIIFSTFLLFKLKKNRFWKI